MRIGLLALLVACFWPTLSRAQERRPPPAVDSTMVVVADLTADGQPDTVLIRVQGDSLDAPLRWSVEIRSEGQVIFTDHSDPEADALLHRLFQDPEFGDKATFYFSTMPKGIVERFQARDGSEMLKRDSPYSVYAVIPAELRKRGVTDPAVLQSAVDGVLRRLTAGTLILVIPDHPYVFRSPMIWIPEIREFVVFYRE